jgi:peptide/nickel transport system substrate-binding protein
MKIQIKRMIAVVTAFSLAVGSAGCGKAKKEPKPTPKTTAKVNEGNADAKGKGANQADVPLVIASTSFSKKFNPFVAASEADKQAVALTQIPLVMNDRAGRLIYKGIDGELRQYGDENYTYYGASDLSVQYDEEKDTTTYRITLRDDLTFSDGEAVTIDDVIFSMYVFCDNDYTGDAALKNMPIQGLLNYQADSTRAEKLSEKKVKRYIKKNPKKLRKWIQKNITKKGITGSEAERLTARQARIFLSEGTGKKVKSISGIERVNDYEMTITTTGYAREMSSALQIPICALHYYGDTSKYNYQKHRFGFSRGDISAICANKTAPMGAGAYRFVKFEDGIVYFTCNELYYLGCPKTAYLQLKDMTDTLKETRVNLQEKISKLTSQETAEQEETINPLAEVTELTQGVADVISATLRKEELQWISSENTNKKLSGKTIQTQLVSDGSYYYIGIHGENVSVGRKAESDKSAALRKALATVFSVSRGYVKEQAGGLAEIVNYPAAAESWVSPSAEDDGYSVAYAQDASGEEILDGEEQNEAKTALAASMALEYLEQAGYQVEGGKAVKAPKGASLSYTVWVAEGESNPLYAMIEQAAATLETIGITLQIKKVSSEEELQKKLVKQTLQIWVGKRTITDMDLKARYSTLLGDNIFGISDKRMNRLVKKLDTLLSSQDRKAVYQKCFEQVLDLAVEVPVCEYKEVSLFSAKRIKADTIPQDITPYYSWLNEIQKVEMN